MKYKMYMKDALGGVYLYTVTVLVLLMFVYANNLRDQVLSKRVWRKLNYSVVFPFIWLLTTPVAVLYFLYFCLEIIKNPNALLNIYVVILVIVVTCNILFYFEILKQIINKKSHKNFANLMTKIVISFILTCLTGSSIILKYLTDSETVTYAVSVCNSFQVLAMTAMFLIPVGNLDET